MDSKEEKGFKILHFETSLQAVMDNYVKGLKGDFGHVHRSQFFINPINNKVLFELFVRDNKEPVGTQERIEV